MATVATTASAPTQSSLYVGDLAPDVTENTLYEIFATHVGNVSSIRVCRDANTRRSLGYAYVNFTDPASAENALLTLNYSSINNKPCRIMWSRRDPAMRRNPKSNLFVKNLEASIDNKTLHDLFSSAGDVLSCKIVTDKDGNSRGIAYVHFADTKGSEAAIAQFNGLVLNDTPVQVMQFVPKKDRATAEDKFTNVFFKNLPTAWKTADLASFGAEAGTITSAHVTTDEAGVSRGFGFLNYSTNAEAKRAVELFNGRALEGQEKAIFAGRALKKADRERMKEESNRKFREDRRKRTQFTNVYVKNLGEDVTDAMLSEVFSKFGPVTSARVMKTEDGASKGFGFVCFETSEQATAAITTLNSSTVAELGVKPLYAALAEPKTARLEKLRQQSQSKVQSYRAPGMAPAPGYYGVGVAASYPYGGAQQARFPYAAAPRGAPGPMYAQAPAARAAQPMSRVPMQAQGARAPAAAPAAPAGYRSALAAQVEAIPPAQRKQYLGESIYPFAQSMHPDDAGKITGMLLELDNAELIKMLENHALLKEKIQEAYRVATEARP